MATKMLQGFKVRGPKADKIAKAEKAKPKTSSLVKVLKDQP